MIRYEDVRVEFGAATALQGLDLTIEEGEFFTLLGPSGCGKTTALRALAGFLRPTSGRIRIDGRDVTDVPSEKRGVGMVFQNYALFPSMDVRSNIEFGLSVQKTPKAERDKRVAEIARRTELSPEQLDKNVSELSGGQQQRVAIARALVLTPKILLLDEPLSNLDAKLRVQLRRQLKELQEEFGVTTVYVTHDQEEALTLSDRIAVLSHGKLEQVGTPEEIYQHSATEFVCRFIGESNRLSPGLVQRIAAGSGTPLSPDAVSYVRPEKIAVARDDQSVGAVLDGTIAQRTYHGAFSTYRVDVGGEDLVVQVIEDSDRARLPGDAVRLMVDPRHVLQYPSGA